MFLRFFQNRFLLLIAIGMTMGIANEANHATAAEPKPAPDKTKEPIWHSHFGPWGNIEIHCTYLEAPDSLIAELPKPNSIPNWNFPGATVASLKQLFDKAALSSEVQARILDPKRMLTKNGVLSVFPPLSDLEAMTHEQRDVIYTELEKSQLNEFQRDPVIIIGGDLDDWLRESHLTNEQQQVIRKMTWHRGHALAFSDIRALLNHAQSDTEVFHICKTMTRTRTLIADLKIPESSDVKPLIKYWTGEGRSPDIEPILESTAERESISTIDITHLLPPMMRRRLFTYPTAERITRGRMPDCHWTSLNFFNSSPDDYYLDTRLASSHIIEHYAPVAAPYQFGDVLIIQDNTGQAIHSCVFID